VPIFTGRGAPLRYTLTTEGRAIADECASPEYVTVSWETFDLNLGLEIDIELNSIQYLDLG
jgi:hypothetical protein